MTCSILKKNAALGGGVHSVYAHGRSRMAINPRVPNMSGHGTHVGFTLTRQISLAPTAKRREVFGESHEGSPSFFQEMLVRRTSAARAYFLTCG